jgi:hypothetical protein
VTRRPLVLAALVLVACGPEPPGGAESGGSPSSPGIELPPSGKVRQWVAVFDTAAHPDDLDPSTEELLEAAAKHIAVQPVQCWDGLANDLGVDAGLYAAAVIAPSRDELEDVVEEVGREPVGEGRYEAFCLD